MQPATLVEPDIQRHPYVFIFLPRLMRPWRNQCRNCLVAQDSSEACFNSVMKIKNKTKFKKNFSIFLQGKKSAHLKYENK